MNNIEINIGDVICFKRNCLAGLVEKTGKVTQISKNNVEVYTETSSSNGWISVSYENITSINGKHI